MYSGDIIELISTLITPITLIYTFLFLLVLGHRYLRIYTRNKVLIFTQGEVKERQKEIEAIAGNIEFEMEMGESARHEVVVKIRKVISLYNELAVGINERLYDEHYIRLVLGCEMMDFYKKYYKTIAFMPDIEDFSDRFMALELLLKRWDKMK